MIYKLWMAKIVFCDLLSTPHQTLLASSCVITAAIKQREDSNTYCFLTDECKWCCFLVPHSFSWRIQCCFFGSSLFYWQMQMLHAHYTFVTFLIVQTIEHITISLQYVGLLIYYVLFSYSTLNSSGVMHQQLLKNPSLFIYFLSYLLPFFFLLSLSTVFLLFFISTYTYVYLFQPIVLLVYDCCHLHARIFMLLESHLQ